MNRKQQHHEAIRERAREALGELYHNATVRYPRLDSEEAERFQSWFEDAAQQEIEYIRDGGANIRSCSPDAAYLQDRYKSRRAREYHCLRAMRDVEIERSDCGMFTGWAALEIAAGNKKLEKVLRGHFRDRDFYRNDAYWECISEYGTIYQYGRGGRTLAPEDLVKDRGGYGWGIIKDYADEMPIASVVRLIKVLESFNRYVKAWCDSVPEQWTDLERERKREEYEARRARNARNRMKRQMRERCDTYAG